MEKHSLLLQLSTLFKVQHFQLGPEAILRNCPCTPQTHHGRHEGTWDITGLLVVVNICQIGHGTCALVLPNLLYCKSDNSVANCKCASQERTRCSLSHSLHQLPSSIHTVGQTGRTLTQRLKEHRRAVTNSYPCMVVGFT